MWPATSKIQFAIWYKQQKTTLHVNPFNVNNITIYNAINLHIIYLYIWSNRHFDINLLSLLNSYCQPRTKINWHDVTSDCHVQAVKMSHLWLIPWLKVPLWHIFFTKLLCQLNHMYIGSNQSINQSNLYSAEAQYF